MIQNFILCFHLSIQSGMVRVQRLSQMIKLLSSLRHDFFVRLTQLRNLKQELIDNHSKIHILKKLRPRVVCEPLHSPTGPFSVAPDPVEEGQCSQSKQARFGTCSRSSWAFWSPTSSRASWARRFLYSNCFFCRVDLSYISLICPFRCWKKKLRTDRNSVSYLDLLMSLNFFDWNPGGFNCFLILFQVFRHFSDSSQFCG